MLKFLNKLIFHKKLDPSKDLYINKNEQLKKFNKVWYKAINEISLYKNWYEYYNLPMQLRSLDELENFPILTKKMLREVFNESNVKSSQYIVKTTGGSSGEPLSIIVDKNSINRDFNNIYLSRKNAKIDIYGKMLLIWGHSHLFGTGTSGKIKQLTRFIKDCLRRISRVSAYELSTKNVGFLVRRIINNDYAYCIGYASTFRLISKYCLLHKISLRDSGIKKIILTSETIYSQDVNDIKEVFGIEPIIEYGMAEFGVIASGYLGRLKVISSDYYVNSVENKLYITDLNNNVFPLINYSCGDYADVYFLNGSYFIGEIKGRNSSEIKIPIINDVDFISDETRLQHFTKNIDGVIKVKFENEDGLLIVKVISYLSENEFKTVFIKNISQQYDVDIQKILFKVTEEIPRTISGKIKL